MSSLNPANKIFSVVSNASGKAKYKVKICNSPSCTCPDFQRYGTRVFCKHLLFALVVFLNIDDNLCKSAVFIGDEDLKIILQREVKPRFLLPVMNINWRSREESLGILQQNKNYHNEQTYILHYKESRSANCLGKNCKKKLEIGSLVSRWLEVTVPYQQNRAVKQVYYFCPKDAYLRSAQFWCNVRYSDVVINSINSNDLAASSVTLTARIVHC